jgi:2-oxoisovalerate dehydrogenase E1 component
MISHGPQLGVDGIALANKLKKNGQITAVFTKVLQVKEIFMRL